MSTPSETTARGAIQREHILDVALALMSEQGSAKTSMRTIASACDLNVAALYHYFESKDALIGAVVDERRYGARLADPPTIDPATDAAARLEQVFATLWKGALDEEVVWRLLLGEGIRGQPASITVGKSLLDMLSPGLSQWIRSVLPEVPDPEALAKVMLGLMFSGFIRHIFEPDLSVETIRAESFHALRSVVGDLDDDLDGDSGQPT